MSTISASTTTTTAYKVTADTTGTLVLQTGSSPTTAVTIDGSQNVGIGTSSPSYPLDVSGIGRFGGATPTIYVQPTTTTNNALFRAVNTGGTAYIGLDSSAGGLTTAYALNLYHSGAYPITFSTSGTERMRIDSSGNVAIGNQSTDGILRLYRTVGTAQWALNCSNSVVSGSGFWQRTNGQHELVLRDTSNNANYITNSSNTLEFVQGGNERFRVASNGGLILNRTDVNPNPGQLYVYSSGSTYTDPYNTNVAQVRIYNSNNTSTSAHSILYMSTAGSAGGDVMISMDISGEAGWCMGVKNSDNTYRINNTWAGFGGNGYYLTQANPSSWQTYSDERLKTIIEPIENGLEKVCSLRSVIGYYNNDEAQHRHPFVIAQDVQAVLPEAVTIADAEEGYLGVGYTDLIPLLIAAVKEQQALIQTLTQRIEALESK